MPEQSSEVVVIMGYNASGKSTLVKQYEDQGFERLNRDLVGGSLGGLEPKLKELLAGGKRQVVLDNTYADVASRKGIIAVAKAQGVPVKCVWLATSFEDAQLNACLRMVQRTGRLLMPEDFKTTKDPNLFPPAALFAYKNRFEQPKTSEGFSEVQYVPFERTYPSEWTNSALILDCDGVLRETSGTEKFPCKPSEVVAIEGRGKRIKEEAKKYDYLLGISNQSGIAKGKLTAADAEACFARTNELQGIDVPWLYCPHNIPPVTCYCRKPSSGLGAVVIHRYKLDPRKCVYIGDMTTDKTFAKRCGFEFIHEADYFR